MAAQPSTLDDLRRAHPEGLFVLFFAEMWERFSYYGMRALLVLFLTKHFLWSDDSANNLYGAYTSLVYLTPLFGGLLADRLLGYRKTAIFGAVLMALGHFAMAFVDVDGDGGRDPWDHQILNFALALLIIGNGAFKPNISSIVGKLYAEGDNRRDAGFTIFYMGINIGAFLSPLLCGHLGEKVGWHWGFGLAGVGMLAGLLNFVCGQHRFRRPFPGSLIPHQEPSVEARSEPVVDLTPNRNANPYAPPKANLEEIPAQLAKESGAPALISDPPNPEFLKRKLLGFLNVEWATYLVATLCIFLAWFLVGQFKLIGVLLIVTTLLALGWVIYHAIVDCGREARNRLFVALALTIFSVVFWAFFEQAGSSINLFTERNVDRHFFDWEIEASQFQSVNALFIILLAPVFSVLWSKLGRYEPAVPMKFALGILQLGIGFAALWFGAKTSQSTGMVPMVWLILGYFFHTTGELCVSPVGLSAITKLSPAKMTGFMLGMWFLASSMAQYVAALVAKLMNIPNIEKGSGPVSPASTVMIYGDVFGKIALVSFATAAIALAVSPWMRRGMHGVR